MNSEVITYTQTVGVVEVRNATGELLTILEPTADVVQIVSPDIVGPRGPQGVAGNPGIQGPAGVPGPQGPFAPTFEQVFASPLATWVIVHNMDVYPVVTLYDSYGFEIGGDITMPDRNTVVVLFEVPIAGTARLKA